MTVKYVTQNKYKIIKYRSPNDVKNMQKNSSYVVKNKT